MQTTKTTSDGLKLLPSKDCQPKIDGTMKQGKHLQSWVIMSSFVHDKDDEALVHRYRELEWNFVLIFSKGQSDSWNQKVHPGEDIECMAMK